jgi:hypothetical protein
VTEAEGICDHRDDPPYKIVIRKTAFRGKQAERLVRCFRTKDSVIQQ